MNKPASRILTLLVMVVALVGLTNALGIAAARAAGATFKWTGSGRQQIPGAATDIGVGFDGSVWVTGTIPAAGGYGICRWAASRIGSNWSVVSGGAVATTVGKFGNPWVVNSAGSIFEYAG